MSFLMVSLLVDNGTLAFKLRFLSAMIWSSFVSDGASPSSENVTTK